MRTLLIFLCCATLLPRFATAEPRQSVVETLDAFHAAAARADVDAYLGLLTRDAVFLGTDGAERWQGEAFRAFVGDSFSGGTGWAYIPQERRLMLSADGNTAWFDEMLDNEQLGSCRGSGVLVQENGEWLIAQYNLSVPIPNRMLLSVVAGIQAVENAAKSGTEPGAEVSASAVEIVLEESADIAEDPTAEVVEGGTSTRCRKRFKTNTRADC